MANSDSKRPTFAVDAIPSDIKNGVFLGNSVLDNVVSCLIAMSTELWATKRRMKVVEAVMTQHGISHEAIEKYVPTEQEVAAWEKDRDRFIDLTLGSLANQGLRDMAADFPKRG